MSDAATEAAIRKIAALLNVTGCTPEEATARTGKAQQLLEAYNLEMAQIDAHSGQSTARLDEQISGGMFNYQRELMRNIAQLNFCWYWVLRVPVRPGTEAAKRGRKTTHEQRLVGRKLNVIATQNMYSYLSGTIERLCRERLSERGDNPTAQFFSSWAIAYREGIADAVTEKVKQRRRDILAEEQKAAKEAAMRAAAAGESAATGLTLANVRDREHAANYDFLYGEGAWARHQEALAQAERDRIAAREQEAIRRAAADKAYAEWALAHPEEAAKEEAERLKAERAEAKKEARRQARGTGTGRARFRETAEEMRRHSSAYSTGYDKGQDVSIDPQMAEDKRRLR